MAIYWNMGFVLCYKSKTRVRRIYKQNPTSKCALYLFPFLKFGFVTPNNSNRKEKHISAIDGKGEERNVWNHWKCKVPSFSVMEMHFGLQKTNQAKLWVSFTSSESIKTMESKAEKEKEEKMRWIQIQSKSSPLIQSKLEVKVNSGSNIFHCQTKRNIFFALNSRMWCKLSKYFSLGKEWSGAEASIYSIWLWLWRA